MPFTRNFYFRKLRKLLIKKILFVFLTSEIFQFSPKVFGPNFIIPKSEIIFTNSRPIFLNEFSTDQFKIPEFFPLALLQLDGFPQFPFLVLSVFKV